MVVCNLFIGIQITWISWSMHEIEIYFWANWVKMWKGRYIKNSWISWGTHSLSWGHINKTCFYIIFLHFNRVPRHSARRGIQWAAAVIQHDIYLPSSHWPWFRIDIRTLLSQLNRCISHLLVNSKPNTVHTVLMESGQVVGHLHCAKPNLSTWHISPHLQTNFLQGSEWEI